MHTQPSPSPHYTQPQKHSDDNNSQNNAVESGGAAQQPSLSSSPTTQPKRSASENFTPWRMASSSTMTSPSSSPSSTPVGAQSLTPPRSPRGHLATRNAITDKASPVLKRRHHPKGLLTDSTQYHGRSLENLHTHTSNSDTSIQSPQRLSLSDEIAHGVSGEEVWELDRSERDGVSSDEEGSGIGGSVVVSGGGSEILVKRSNSDVGSGQHKLHSFGKSARSIPSRLSHASELFAQPVHQGVTGDLIKSYPAVYVKQHRPSQGKIYVYSSHVIFESFTRNTFISIPFTEIEALKVPNLRPGLKVTTKQKAYKFGGLLHKQRLFALVQQLWAYSKGETVLDIDALRLQMILEEDTLKLEREKLKLEKKEKKMRMIEDKEREKQEQREREIKEKQDREKEAERERKEREREKLEKKEREKREKEEKKKELLEKKQQKKNSISHNSGNSSSGRKPLFKKKKGQPVDEYLAKAPPTVYNVPDQIVALQPPHRQCEIVETLNFCSAARAWHLLFGEASESFHFHDALVNKMGHNNVAFSAWTVHNGEAPTSGDDHDNAHPHNGANGDASMSANLEKERETTSVTKDEEAATATDGNVFWQRALVYSTRLNTMLAAGDFIVDQTQRTCRARNGKYLLATESRLNRLPWDSAFLIHSYWHIKENTTDKDMPQAIIKIWTWTEWYKTPPAFFKSIIEDVEAKQKQCFVEVIANARRVLDKEEAKRALMRTTKSGNSTASGLTTSSKSISTTITPVNLVTSSGSIAVPTINLRSNNNVLSVTALTPSVSPHTVVNPTATHEPGHTSCTTTPLSSATTTQHTTTPQLPHQSSMFSVRGVLYTLLALVFLYYYWQTCSLSSENERLTDQVNNLQQQLLECSTAASTTTTTASTSFF
eukprot:TRINITY_DN1376_c2_g1_i3.p1 TRINITY_DN1376_c2_g1~~TRINITY_DN1376_c2_g1_i3.p1  ORF type:complete len:885 (+),score=232.06 TRINITY_DN1376_c2_g1_i3:222-2876(+)